MEQVHGLFTAQAFPHYMTYQDISLEQQTIYVFMYVYSSMGSTDTKILKLERPRDFQKVINEKFQHMGFDVYFPQGVCIVF